MSVCLIGVCCSGCSSEQTPSEESSTADISGNAMDNFVKKLNAGNYVIDAQDYLRTTVYSPEQVYYSYYDGGYEDYAFMTLKGETFQCVLEDDGVTQVEYLSSDNAIELASGLPNYWMEASDNNMFNLFYNDVEKPLQFVSYDSTVKSTLIRLAGYGNSALNLMHEVYMELDKEDPESVHFTAVVDDNEVARIFYDDLDLTLEFGKAVSDPRIEKWMKNPVYPATRTEWTEDDLFYLNSVFNPGYGKDALPFPDFASYALKFDDEVFAMHQKIYLTDGHGTEKDLENYKKTLLNNGFSEVSIKAEDGSEETVYRRILRDAYNCYVSVYPFYDNGFAMTAETYYDNPKYDGLEEINAVITDKGFPALPENEHIEGWSAEDRAKQRTEGWLYFFDYDISMEISSLYNDEAAVSAYMEEYGKLLEEKGFSPYFSSDDEELPDYYKSPNEYNTFRYKLSDGNKLEMQFSCEKNMAPAEAASKVTGAGFPAVEFTDEMTCRDISDYHKMTRDFNGFYFAVSQPFATNDDAKAFLDKYTAALEDAGYYYENPQVIGSLKSFAYYNEEKDMFFAFDLFEGDDGATVNMDFVKN